MCFQKSVFVNILFIFEFYAFIREIKYTCFNCGHSWDPNM